MEGPTSRTGAYDRDRHGQPQPPPRYHRGPHHPGGASSASSSSSSFERPSSRKSHHLPPAPPSHHHHRHHHHRGGSGGPIFSSSYEVPPSPIVTGGTPPPMSISTDESEDYGLDDLFRGAGGGRRGADDAGGDVAASSSYRHGTGEGGGGGGGGGRGRFVPPPPPSHSHGHGRYGHPGAPDPRYDYDHRRDGRSGRSGGGGGVDEEHERAPPGGSIFRGYEGINDEYPRRRGMDVGEDERGEGDRRRHYEGYVARAGGGPSERSLLHRPHAPPDHYPPHRQPHPHSHPHPHPHSHPHPPLAPSQMQMQSHWGRHADTPPPRLSCEDGRLDGMSHHHPLPAAVSPSDRAGARSGDSVASSDIGCSPYSRAGGESCGGGGGGGSGGGGKPPTGKPPQPPSAAVAAGNLVSPPPLPAEARLAGHRRMPCRARSVPVGHTPQTAYLSIPPDAPHGMVLICSHPECASSGKRFRFCAVCDIPVAKRNFLKRHSHGLVSPGSPAAQVGQPGAITGKDAVAMARSLGTVSPAAGAGSAPISPRSESSASHGVAGGGEAVNDDDDDDDDDADDVAELAEVGDNRGDAKAPAPSTSVSSSSSDDDAAAAAAAAASANAEDDASKRLLHRPMPSRAPSLSSADVCDDGHHPLSPKSPFSTGSVRPRSNSDDSNRSAFGNPVKRPRDGGSTPPKDRFRPPESIDLALPRMPGDSHDRGGGSVGGGPGPNSGYVLGYRSGGSGGSSRDRGPSGTESPRPISPPRLQACRTFPLPPPHREPRFATADPLPPESYYGMGARWPPSGFARHEEAGVGCDDGDAPPTPSRLMVAGVSAHSRPGAALNYDHERRRRSLADSRPPPESESECLSDGDDIGLNRNDASGFHAREGGKDFGSGSATSLSNRRKDDVSLRRFRDRLRNRDGASGRRRNQKEFPDRAKSPPGPDDFEPPTPEVSVVRLSRKERQWLELLRKKPAMSDMDDLEEWMDEVLEISDGTKPSVDGSSSGEGPEWRPLNEVVRQAHPRPLNTEDPADEETGPADISNEGENMLTDNDDEDDDDGDGGDDVDKDDKDGGSNEYNRHLMPRDEAPLGKESVPPSTKKDGLMEARAQAKRNLHLRAARTSSGIVDSANEESRTDIDATDHSLSGSKDEAHGSNRRRDASTPPPICFTGQGGLASLFGCGAFLCADTGNGGGFLGGGGGGGPCAPCAYARNAEDSRAGSPVLDIPAPIPMNRRVNSKGSVSSVSMTGSSMVDLLEGTGLMPGTPHTFSHTPRNSDGEFRYLDNIMMDSPFGQSMQFRGGSITSVSMSKIGDQELNNVGDEPISNKEKKESDEKDGDEKKKGASMSPLRGTQRLPSGRKAMPALPSLKKEDLEAMKDEFRVGDVNISMNKSTDDGEMSEGDNVETELKEEQNGSTRAKQEENAAR